MKIAGQYNNLTLKHSSNSSYSPNFGIKFKMPVLLADIFVKQKDSVKNITKIKKLHAGKFGTECKNSIPLANFEEMFGLKELEKLYKKGLSTNTEGWADAFLKAKADRPLSTSSVYDCSVMYLFNKDTNTHFLYHSQFNKDKTAFDTLIKTFMPEGFTKADILPGINKWYARHWETLPKMLQALKENNKNAIVNVHHYSSKMPEVVGYNGNLYEIPNHRIEMGFYDKGQASFKICDMKANSLLEEVKYNSKTLAKIAVTRELYAQKGYNAEILKILNRLLDEYQQKLLSQIEP